MKTKLLLIFLTLMMSEQSFGQSCPAATPAPLVIVCAGNDAVLNSPPAGGPVAGVYTYEWSGPGIVTSGPGMNAFDPSPVITAASGDKMYLVSVTDVISGVLCLKDAVVWVHAITGSPSALFYSSPLAVPTPPGHDIITVCLNQQVDFFQTLTNVTSWSWDFGDGVITINDPNPHHTYSNPGIYDVKLTVSNGCGEVIYYVEVKVENLVSPQIECPSVVCQGVNRNETEFFPLLSL